MRRFALLGLDVALLLAATYLALILRDNFETSVSRVWATVPFAVATVVCGAVVFAGAGLNRSVWRFSSLPDYLRVTAAVGLVAIAACVAAFAYNRLDGIARSLPILQFIIAVMLLTGARVLHRMAHVARQSRKDQATLLKLQDRTPDVTVLLVGITRLAETYLQAAASLAPSQVHIAGIIGGSDRHSGRLLSGYPILGALDNVEEILNTLDVHGVQVDRIVVAVPFKTLNPDERAALIRAERSRGITLQFLARDLGFESAELPAKGALASSPQTARPLSFELSAEELNRLSQRRFWPIKRFADVTLAGFTLIACSPLILLVVLAVAASVGLPVVFWQRRPGLGGRPFRMYKFRTMRAAHTPDGRLLTDEERVSRIGSLLRRLRLDEFPQLYNILRGDMSFVGPRPLLSREQSDNWKARLLVRPGLTGWAQVTGGRDIPASDKAALDVWYVKNASLLLDLEIAIRTVPILIFGERISRGLIERAWKDLSQAGIVRGERIIAQKRLAHGLEPPIRPWSSNTAT